MKLKELLGIRKLREDREMIIRCDGLERRYYVWQLMENDILLNKSIKNEYYDNIHDRYGVTLSIN